MATDWTTARSETLARLDIAREAERLGVCFSAAGPNAGGWRECYAIGRNEKKPSAAINIASRDCELGTYTDLGSGERLSFFDLAAKLQPAQFADWRAAHWYYAKQAGVELPKSKGDGGRANRTKPLMDQIEFRDDGLASSRMLIKMWANAKIPITPESVRAAGGRVGVWPPKAPEAKRNNVIAFCGFRPDDWSQPTAIILYRPDGREFIAGPNGNPPERKTHLVRGSVDSLIIVGGPTALAAAEVVHLCEGPPDALTLAGQLPAGHVAVTNTHGSGKFADELHSAFAGKVVLIHGDADRAGVEGAKLRAGKLLPVATEIKIVPLPYEVTESHGKDLRDFFVEGGTFEQLDKLAAGAKVLTAEDVPPPRNRRPSRRAEAKPIASGESSFIELDTPAGRTDTANARRFVALHGNDVRWCDPWRKWLVWDCKRWVVDAQRRIEALAKQVADEIWRELAGALPSMEKDSGNEIIRFARTTSNARGIGDMLALVKSEPGIAILPAVLDAHPWLFNCLNCTVDLKTGSGMPHSREHYITKLCPHEYQPQSEAEPTVWNTTLERIFGGNVELLGFFRRLCGSAMVGEVIEQLLPILWGKGSNGKSLVMETLLKAMGCDYADKGASELLLASQGDRHPTEKADLFGKRLIVCTETEDGRRLAESIVKELTGGDTVKGRRMKEDLWSFKPSHSLFLVTNHKPIIRGTDHGIWRRLPLIPFTQQFWDGSKGESGPAEYEADPRLKEKLRPEMPGILHWLVEACLEWQREGLRQPAEVAAATADYRGTMDTLAEFLADCCTLQEGCTTKAADVLRRYAEWCKERNDKPVSSRRFGEYLAERGITKRRSGGVWYSGLLVRESF